MDLLQVSLYLLILLCLIAVVLYLKPALLMVHDGFTSIVMEGLAVQGVEGFTTLAVDEHSMPKCFLRDTEAQRLMAQFRGLDVVAPGSDAANAYNELKLILQKMLCIDADVSGMASGVYSTYQLPFATAHDIEPPPVFVNRCVKHAVRSRDIEVVMDKFESRGFALIEILCACPKKKKSAQNMFHEIVARVTRNIAGRCLAQKATLDRPAGPRDPGFFMPPELDTLRPYTILGDPQWL